MSEKAKPRSVRMTVSEAVLVCAALADAAGGLEGEEGLLPEARKLRRVDARIRKVFSGF